jgi:hypothetical protein
MANWFQDEVHKLTDWSGYTDATNAQIDKHFPTTDVKPDIGFRGPRKDAINAFAHAFAAARATVEFGVQTGIAFGYN